MAQMARRCCDETGEPAFRNSGMKARNAPRTVGRSDTLAGKELWLAWQPLAEFVHQTQSLPGGLVGQMQVKHRGGDLFMAEQLLDHVQMRARLKKMGGKTVAQRVH